jgi:hypothetical protein
MDSIPASDMQHENYPYFFYKIYQARQTKFLTGFPTDDLFEINRVVSFLNFIASCIMVKVRGFVSTCNLCEYIFAYKLCLTGNLCLDDWSGLFLFAGPTFIMNQYQDREEDADDDIPFQNFCGYLCDGGPYTEFLNHSLTELGTRYDPHIQKRILDSVEGAEDLCTYSISTDTFG